MKKDWKSPKFPSIAMDAPSSVDRYDRFTVDLGDIEINSYGTGPPMVPLKDRAAAHRAVARIMRERAKLEGKK